MAWTVAETKPTRAPAMSMNQAPVIHQASSAPAMGAAKPPAVWPSAAVSTRAATKTKNNAPNQASGSAAEAFADDCMASGGGKCSP